MKYYVKDSQSLHGPIWMDKPVNELVPEILQEWEKQTSVFFCRHEGLPVGEIVEEGKDFKWKNSYGMPKNQELRIAIPINAESPEVAPQGEENEYTRLVIGKIEVNCFDEDSEISVRVGRSRYQSLSVDEAQRLADYLLYHIKCETSSNGQSTQQEGQEELVVESEDDALNHFGNAMLMRLQKLNSRDIRVFLDDVKPLFRITRKP